jgi:hypothetical protein
MEVRTLFHYLSQYQSPCIIHPQLPKVSHLHSPLSSYHGAIYHRQQV